MVKRIVQTYCEHISRVCSELLALLVCFKKFAGLSLALNPLTDVLARRLRWREKVGFSRPFLLSVTDKKADWILTVTMAEKHKIILGAFYHRRYGVSPVAARGSVESHAKKHDLRGADYGEALESAIACGLIGVTSDASLAIRDAGRQLLPKG